MAEDTGKQQGVGYKRPPKNRQFGQPEGNPRNDKGVPREAIAARHLFQEVAGELLNIDEKGEDGQVRKAQISRLKAMIRLKFSSRAPQDFVTILKALYPGLLRDEVVAEFNDSEGALTDDERLARMKKLAVAIAKEVKRAG